MAHLPDQPDASPPPEDSIPQPLAEDLSALFAGPRVPAQVDAAILSAARAHQAKVARSGAFSRHRRLLRWAGAGAAAAAAVAAVAMIVVRLHATAHAPATVARGPGASSPPTNTRPALAGDIDGNGRIDILDAFTVARALADPHRTGPLPAAWDVNGDGVVDQKDVDWLASAAVRVGAAGGVADADHAKPARPARPADVIELAQNLGMLEAGGSASAGGRRVARLDANRRSEHRLPAAAIGEPDKSEGGERAEDAKGAAAQ